MCAAHPNRTLLGLILLYVSTSSAVVKQCVVEETPKERTFSSLVEYQGSKISFDNEQPGYQGNEISFSFHSIDKIPKNAFISFDSDSIVKISLNDKGIETISDGAFLSLFCLHFLELRGNNISVLTSGVFAGLENLRALDLSENLLENAVNFELAFHRLKRLTVLNLSRNMLKTLNELVFYNLTRLETLNLSYNKIRTLKPDVFASLKSLKELYLNNNRLGDLEPEKWSGLKSLQLLNLAGNSLTKFDPTYNFSFAGLKNLNLSGNSLSYLNVFGLRYNFPKLETIDITGNDWYCENLAVIKHELADSKITEVGTANCSTAGEYRKPSTEQTTTTTTIATSTPTRKVRDYSRDVFVQNGEILFTNRKVMENIKHLESLVVYLFVVVILFAAIDMAVRIGICHNLYGRMTGRNRNYIDGNDIENMGLVHR